MKISAQSPSDTFILVKVSHSHTIQDGLQALHTRWVSRSISSWAFLHSPVAQVDVAASLLGEAAVARRLQPLGILGRARHVRRVQTVHGADPPRLRLRALDGVAHHHETYIIQRITPFMMENESDERKELGGRRGGRGSYHTAGDTLEEQA